MHADMYTDAEKRSVLDVGLEPVVESRKTVGCFVSLQRVWHVALVPRNSVIRRTFPAILSLSRTRTSAAEIR